MHNDLIRVLISHGNPLVAAGLEAAFSARSDLQVLGSCAPDAVLEAVSRLMSPMVVVTDWHAGMGVLTSLHARNSRVLILTDDHSELSIRRAVELGVRGYLSLSSDVETVSRAVGCVHGGGTALDPVVMTKIAVSLASPALTGRELDVLRLMMQGMPNKAIARSLKFAVGTAKSHVKAIMSKLDVRTRVAAIAVARRRGLVPDESIAMPPGRAVTGRGRVLDSLR